jgi:hypothetical protein
MNITKKIIAKLNPFFSEIVVILFSFALFFLGILYSDDPGFYSRELMSSNSDDFDLFIVLTQLNLLGFICGIINLLINIFLLKKKNKVIYVSQLVYGTIFFIQLFFLFSINLDTSLKHVFFTFDLFSIWVFVFFIGIASVIFVSIAMSKTANKVTIIKLNFNQKRFVIFGFIVCLIIIIFLYFFFFNPFIK